MTDWGIPLRGFIIVCHRPHAVVPPPFLSSFSSSSIYDPLSLFRMEDDLLAGAVSPEAAAAAVVVPSPVAATGPAAPLPLPESSPAAPRTLGEVGSSDGGLQPREVSGDGDGGGTGGAAAAPPSPPSPELAMLLEVVDRFDGTGGSA